VFPAWLILRPWWRWHVLPKRRFTFNGLHGVISQKKNSSNLTSAAPSDSLYLDLHKSPFLLLFSRIVYV
jgi:hypothetical protein